MDINHYPVYIATHYTYGVGTGGGGGPRRAIAPPPSTFCKLAFYALNKINILLLESTCTYSGVTAVWQKLQLWHRLQCRGHWLTIPHGKVDPFITHLISVIYS